MRTKPLDAPTAARAMRMSEKQVRAHVSYDPETDLVQVPAFIADSVAFEQAKLDFVRALTAAMRPALKKINSAMLALTRVSRRS